MWTWTSVSVTIIPALSPPHVTVTSVMCAEVAVEHARIETVATIETIAGIRIVLER
jgi:hypothetical protein